MTFSRQPSPARKPNAIMDSAKTEARKETAKAWFEALRDRLLTALEDVERALPAGAPMSECAAGQFTRSPWQRTDHTGPRGGGGVMAIMRGRVNCPAAHSLIGAPAG